MEMRRFKVINTTVKPIRRCPKTGRDLRKTAEKVGHPVQFRDHRDQVVAIPVSRSRIIDEKDITSQLLNLRRGRFIHIEVIEDIVEELKKFTVQREADKDALRGTRRPLKANAVEMGKDNHGQKRGIEHEDAINPDGDPNFVTKAPTLTPQTEQNFEVTALRQEGDLDAPGQRSNSQDGQSEEISEIVSP